MKYLANSPANAPETGTARVTAASGELITRIPRQSIQEFRSEFGRISHEAAPGSRLEIALWACGKAIDEAQSARKELKERRDAEELVKGRHENGVRANEQAIGGMVLAIRKHASAISEISRKAKEGHAQIEELEAKCASSAKLIPELSRQICACIGRIPEKAVICNKSARGEMIKIDPLPAEQLVLACQARLGGLKQTYQDLTGYTAMLEETYAPKGILGLSADSHELYKIVEARTKDDALSPEQEREVREKQEKLHDMAKRKQKDIRALLSPVETVQKKAAAVMAYSKKTGGTKVVTYDWSAKVNCALSDAIGIGNGLCMIIGSFPEHHTSITNTLAGYSDAIGKLGIALKKRKELEMEKNARVEPVGLAEEQEKIDGTLRELCDLKARLEQEQKAVRKKQEESARKRSLRLQNRYTKEQWQEKLLEMEIECLPKFEKPKKQAEQPRADGAKEEAMKLFLDRTHALFEDELDPRSGLREPFLNRLKELAGLYLANGKLTRRIIQERYSYDLSHHERVPGKGSNGFDLVRVSLGRNSEKRLMIDVENPIKPAILFVGNKEASMKFMKRVNNGELPGISELSLQKGAGELFPALLG